MKRALLKALVRIPLPREGIPENYKLYRGYKTVPKGTLDSLVDCYRRIFNEPPWNENWKREEVLEKIEKDLVSETSFLVVLNEDGEVKGFAWGDVIDSSKIKKRAARALGVEEERIKLSAPQEKVMYCDELAIDRTARGGIGPIKNLWRRAADNLGEEPKSTIFWSTPESRIVPVVKVLGYEVRGQTMKDDKRIIFLYHPDVRTLKRLTSLKAEKMKSLMRLLSKLRG